MAAKIKNFFNSFKRKVSSSAKKSLNFLNTVFFKNVFYEHSIQSWILTYLLLVIYQFFGMDEETSLRLSLSRKFSNLLKYITRIYLPKALRNIVYKTYSKIYNINLEEVQEDIQKFKNFNEFFTRKIKPRYIDTMNTDEIVSPADSKILSMSEIVGDECLLIKERYYRLGELLTGIKDHKLTQENINSLKRNPSNKLYQCVFYLNPGDYHRFHSPSDFLVSLRNHIVGYLLPVKESYIMKHERVYEINERVALFGEWKHGFLSMILVGAMNVGTIALNFDKELSTNTKLKKNFIRNNFKDYGLDEKAEKGKTHIFQKDFLFQNQNITTTSGKRKSNGKTKHFSRSKKGVAVKKGDEMGRFNMGSTVVLIFETKENFVFESDVGDRVVYGQRIGSHQQK